MVGFVIDTMLKIVVKMITVRAGIVTLGRMVIVVMVFTMTRIITVVLTVIMVKVVNIVSLVIV